MTRTKSIIGGLVLCAVALCAFGAASASAKGLTAVTCKNEGSAGHQFSTTHCKTSEGSGNFETVPIEGTTKVAGESTKGEGEAGEETSRLTTTIGGVNVVVTCATATGTGEVTNTTVGEEMKAHGTKTVITYGGCHAVLKSKENRTCNVSGITGGVGAGKIQTTALTSTTTGVNHQVKFEPETPEEFTKFEILTTGTECFFSTAQTVPVTGSVEGEANTTTHSHLTFTEANNGTSLRIGGPTGPIAHYTGTYGTWMDEEPEKTVGLTTF